MIHTEDMAQPTQTDPQFKLRLPADLKDRVQRASERNNRSMNAEIVAALEEKFPKVDLFDALNTAVIEARDKLEKMEPGPERDAAYKRLDEQLAYAHNALGEIEKDLADALKSQEPSADFPFTRPKVRLRQLKQPPKK
ncbi:Arc family DNA-binding protein [Sulfitobacter faviae]|uniref:Arc family DNA-binding protein n=1 Tax=Sulfitobacter faviae TaxID=1775881 RepID=UPI002307235F|nr:Arc family DNA-binding protein [Sulfitobacter faviae]WCE67978.1 Arc family DNA-binding protein [Sulfitobacter faviae]